MSSSESSSSRLFLGNLSNSTLEVHQTKVFVLNNQQHLESSLFRISKGSTIEFCLGPSLFGKQIKIFTNHPLSAEKDFNRNTYQLLNWDIENGEKPIENCLDDTSLVASLLVHRSGTFHYFFTDDISDEPLGSGYFIVDPVLSFNDDEIVPLDSIRCQTVLSKSLGTFDKWEGRLMVSKESGYNMIHFTPIQELGESNSSYSLKNQLQLNSAFSNEHVTPSFEDVIKLTKKMKHEWKVLSVGDVVLNHTANESPWLVSHPECTYNMINSPHLIPAAVLDGYLHVFTKEIESGKYSDVGIPKVIFTEDHLHAIKNHLETILIPQIRLHEFYSADVEKLSEEFLVKAKARIPATEILDRRELALIIGPSYGRNQATVDLELALKIFNINRTDITDENLRLSMCVDDFKKRLIELNSEKKNEVMQHLAAAVINCISNARYFRIQGNGPQWKEVSEKYPLVPRYFTGNFSSYESVEAEVLNNGQFVMAHNGWVMDYDPLKNFADPDSYIYLRRELIAWGDSVKLRYGNSYADCPFLWDLMKNYVEMTAKIFDGIRLDNCHSTPLPVAEYLLDCARKIRPDLYVVAELFTNSDKADNIFVNRLGITSLIREAMSAWDSHELGRLVHRFGGEPVGSFCKMNKTPLVPSVAHALFYDVTHDNPSPIEKKCVYDLIPTAALVSMACCATGGSRGYDELVPHHIHVVDENRLYASWTNDEVTDNSTVGINSGIIRVKRALNKIHGNLSKEGYNQVYVDQMNDKIVAVTRHNPQTHESVILVSYTSFAQPLSNVDIKPNVRNLKFEGELVEILMEASLCNKNKENDFSAPKDFVKDDAFINGLSDFKVIMKENVKLEESDVLKRVHNDDEKLSEFEFKKFVPGSIIIIRAQPHHSPNTTLQYLKDLTNSFLAAKFDNQIISTVSELNLTHLNYALYRCSEEDSEEGMGAYSISGYGTLIYCGLQGFESILKNVRTNNDLGHPLCENLRNGDWMLDYISGRLKASKGTAKLGLLFEEIFNRLRLIPRYLIPRYFEVIVSSIYQLLISRAAFQMSEFVRNGSTFVRYLAMGSVQCVGFSASAPLPPFSPSIMVADDDRKKVTMCAGLPHFTTGYMRCWGRDTFISLRGLLLLTGRYEEARFHILGYGACLRHGLIPNLLDRGVNARYNCRDAVWWWLHSIMSYIDIVPNGHNLLKDRVSRIFPNDDCPPMGPGLYDQPLYEVMQEALSVHFRGLSFVERNAGPGIDAHMTERGFHNTIGIDLNTGFVFGGNEFNCGTWMDKMGSDIKSGNKGKPATPRDGSAVELVALCKAVVRKLHQLHDLGIYPYSGVERIDKEGNSLRWSFKNWEDMISKNFEKFFWIPEHPSPWEKRPDLVHRREIYKDSFGASQPWADYQLRCNFLIALVVAPEMLDPGNAWKAIKKSEDLLLGPLGIKTLDPADWNYNGEYHNDDVSGDPKVAHGFNYHQGPEWLWPVGYFLRSKLHFGKMMGEEVFQQTIMEVRSYLGNHYADTLNSPWCGLPELTNKNGAYCSDGCRLQAWSMATILEVLYDLHCIEKEHKSQ